MVDQSLSGITVLDLTTRVAGPYATKLLAMFGAHVIKVEPPGRGDISRWLGPFLNDTPNPEQSALFAYLNTGKKSITLDITKPSGGALCRALAAHCDLVVEDFTPGILTGLSLAHADLAHIRPTLSMVSITPYGQTGPYRTASWSTITLFAMGGQMAMTGEPDRSPLMPYGYQAEYQLGLNAYAASVTAVYGARMNGRGQHVDIAGIEIQAATLEGTMPRAAYAGEVSRRRGNHGSATSGVYPCKDGYIGILAIARNWPALVGMLGMPELMADPRFKTAADRRAHDDDVQAILYGWFLERTKMEILDRAGAAKAPVSPILTVQELFASPQLQERGFFQRVTHPVLGDQWYPGPPFNLTATPGQIAPAPLLGQHNAETFSTILGLGTQQLVQLAAQGII